MLNCSTQLQFHFNITEVGRYQSWVDDHRSDHHPKNCRLRHGLGRFTHRPWGWAAGISWLSRNGCWPKEKKISFLLDASMTTCLFWCGRCPLKPCRMLQPNPQDNPKFRKRLDALRTPDDQSNSNWSLSAVLFVWSKPIKYIICPWFIMVYRWSTINHGNHAVFVAFWASNSPCSQISNLVGGQFCASSRSWDILGRYNMMSKNVKAQIKQQTNRSSNLSVYLSIYLSVCLSIYLSICLSIYLSNLI